MALPARAHLRQLPLFLKDMARRFIEIAGSVILLVLSSPLFLITALAVWATDFGPVFYRQTRAGRFERPFELIKFRSMQVTIGRLTGPRKLGKPTPS